MSRETEIAMLAAIAKHFTAENPTGTMTKLRAVEVRAVTDNGDHPSGERLTYRAGTAFGDLLILAAPDHAPGTADPPCIRTYSTDL